MTRLLLLLWYVAKDVINLFLWLQGRYYVCRERLGCCCGGAVAEEPAVAWPPVVRSNLAIRRLLADSASLAKRRRLDIKSLELVVVVVVDCAWLLLVPFLLKEMG